MKLGFDKVGRKEMKVCLNDLKKCKKLDGRVKLASELVPRGCLIFLPAHFFASPHGRIEPALPGWPCGECVSLGKR